MHIIENSEILHLYKKCNVSTSNNLEIRNTINMGTLNNKLNTGGNPRDPIANAVWSNNTVVQTKPYAR